MIKYRSSLFVYRTVILFSILGVLISIGHFFIYSLTDRVGFLIQIPRYIENYVLALLHVVPAIVFMTLVPFQLNQRIRNSHIRIHKLLGRVFVALVVVISGSGFALGIIMPFAGVGETMVISLIGMSFLFSLGLGIKHIRNGNANLHRIWMSRMLAVGFTPVTMRIIFTVGSNGFGFEQVDIFSLSLILGMLINLLVVQLWMSRKNVENSVVDSFKSSQYSNNSKINI